MKQTGYHISDLIIPPVAKNDNKTKEIINPPTAKADTKKQRKKLCFRLQNSFRKVQTTGELKDDTMLYQGIRVHCRND